MAASESTDIDPRAQVRAVEALIAPDSGQGYTPIGGLRMFRERQIRDALAGLPSAPTVDADSRPALPPLIAGRPLSGVVVPGTGSDPSETGIAGELA